MNVRLPRQSKTMKTMECTESGYKEIRVSPCYHWHRSKRQKRYRATIPAMAEANKRRSFMTCLHEAFINFDKNDYCFTITFNEDVPDTERKRLIDNIIKRLQRKYGRYGEKLRYMIFWGRGDEKEKLHIHILINRIRYIRFSELCKICRGKGKVNVYIKKIGKDYPPSESNSKILKNTIRYLYKHWETLTDEDKKITKMHNNRWIPSRTLNKVEVTETYDDDDTEQPFERSPSKQLKAYWNAWQKSSDDFDRLVEKNNPNFRVMSYRYYSGTSPFYTDDYGNTFLGVELYRIGSKIDFNDNTVVQIHKSGNKKCRYVIDKDTGEVVQEDVNEITPSKKRRVVIRRKARYPQEQEGGENNDC